MQPISITPGEYVEVKECLEDPVHVNPVRWFRACHSLKPFWNDKGHHRGKPVDLDILYDFVAAYYDVYDHYQCDNHHQMKLQHPLAIHSYMDDPDDYGISIEDMRDFAYKCLELNRYCMYFFRFLNNDTKAAEIVLGWGDDNYMLNFKTFGHLWFEKHIDSLAYEDLEDDDLYHPLVLFDGLMENKSFIHSLIEQKYDVDACVLHFLSHMSYTSKLLNSQLVEKWLSCQKEKIEFVSDTPGEDTELLENNYIYYKALCK